MTTPERRLALLLSYRDDPDIPNADLARRYSVSEGQIRKDLKKLSLPSASQRTQNSKPRIGRIVTVTTTTYELNPQ